MKSRKSILLLFLANFVSAVSQGISMIAIPWYFTREDMLVGFGIIYMITNVLALIWVPLAGVLTDRYSRKKILMVLMSILGAIILLISAVGYINQELSWLLVAIVFVIIFLNYNIHYPTLYAFVHEMTEPQYYGRVTSMIEIQGQLAMVISGSLAAVLLSGVPEEGWSLGSLHVSLFAGVEPWKIYEIFLVDGLSYFLGVGILMAIPFVSGQHLNKERERVVNRLKKGLTYLSENRYVMIFGFASYVAFMTMIIHAFYLVAPYVYQHLEADALVYSGSKIIYSFGAVMSGLLIRVIFRKVTNVDSVLIMTATMGVVYLLFFGTKWVGLFLFLGVIIGLSNAGIRIQRVTYLFGRVPNEVFGRVNSIFNLGNILARVVLLGLFSLPFFQTNGQVIWAYFIVGMLCLIGAGVIGYYRKEIIHKRTITER